MKTTITETHPTIHKTISCSPDGRKAEIVIKTAAGVYVTRHVSRKLRSGDFKSSTGELYALQLKEQG